MKINLAIIFSLTKRLVMVGRHRRKKYIFELFLYKIVFLLSSEGLFLRSRTKNQWTCWGWIENFILSFKFSLLTIYSLKQCVVSTVSSVLNA